MYEECQSLPFLFPDRTSYNKIHTIFKLTATTPTLDFSQTLNFSQILIFSKLFFLPLNLNFILILFFSFFFPSLFPSCSPLPGSLSFLCSSPCQSLPSLPSCCLFQLHLDACNTTDHHHRWLSRSTTDQGLNHDPDICRTFDTQHVFEWRRISVPSNGKQIHRIHSCSEPRLKVTWPNLVEPLVASVPPTTLLVSTKDLLTVLDLEKIDSVETDCWIPMWSFLDPNHSNLKFDPMPTKLWTQPTHNKDSPSDTSNFPA